MHAVSFFFDNACFSFRQSFFFTKNGEMFGTSNSVSAKGKTLHATIGMTGNHTTKLAHNHVFPDKKMFLFVPQSATRKWRSISDVSGLSSANGRNWERATNRSVSSIYQQLEIGCWD